MYTQISKNIDEAIRLLTQNELVAIPTETVYGLAGNALNALAVAKIFEVKNRPTFDPLIVHTHSANEFQHFAQNIPDLVYELADAFLPAPLTFVLQKRPNIPFLVTSGGNTVALRVPNHLLTLELLRNLHFPLAAPSANPFGYVSPTSARHVADQLGHKIPLILDGGFCQVGLESTIIGFDEVGDIVVFRLGGLPLEAIEKKMDKKIKNINLSSSKPNAPGMLLSHYSPQKKLIVGDIKANLIEFGHLNLGIISFNTFFETIAPQHQIQLSVDCNVSQAATNLFSALRTMDKIEGIDLILTEFVPDVGLGRAINDRLTRASV